MSIPQSTVPITLGLSGGVGVFCVQGGDSAVTLLQEERDRVAASPNLDSPFLDRETRGAELWTD